VLKNELFRKLKQLNEEGMTILLVEQNANLALHLAHRGYVLDTGNIVAEGTSEELLGNPDVKKAYLGG
jgi:branched-chain amino acid transport system ATP-binding protein